MSTQKISLEKLHIELKNNLSFWLKNGLHSNNKGIHSEISIDNTPNLSATMGSMYISRALYGASTAFSILQNKAYINLADKSFKKLQEFKNPKGGYYWSKTASNTYSHDPENVNMSQAFVLYGLVAYAKVKNSGEVDLAIENHVAFIKNTLYDKNNGGYIDGFNENWNLTETPTKALGTHLHLLEAFVKLYEYNKKEELVSTIEELITIILNHFTTKNTFDCLHRLTPNWKPLVNEIWAGHNAECSWILCNASEVIKNKELINECNQFALNTMQQITTKAIDTTNSGVFNVLKNNKPTEKVKIWWPQAEVTIAYLNCYNITKDQKHLSQATNLINFISEYFICSNGEWYTEILNTGKPNNSLPIIHFWKSMYHTVRYYAELNKRITDLNL